MIHIRHLTSLGDEALFDRLRPLMSDKPEATFQCNLTPDTTWREVRVEVDSLELGLCGLINHSFRDLGSRPKRCASRPLYKPLGPKSSFRGKLADFVVPSLSRSPRFGRSIGSRMVSDSSTDRSPAADGSLTTQIPEQYPAPRTRVARVRINTAGHHIKSTP